MGTHVGGTAVAAELKLFVREEWGEVLEWNTVSYIRWVTTIDLVDAGEWEVLFTLMWWTNVALDDITSLQSVALHKIGSYVDIIWR